MNGFRNSSRNGQVWRWQRAGSRAVSLEVRGFRKEAAEAWLLAARVAPRTTAAWRLQIENRPGSSCCCRTPRRICML
ncbi:hypothetical protein [Escherichia coli]|uniref:hypothetical protein n=1 Tax=Escherichia coli TaxID=562 RepID=UPI001F3478BB|nr:hypothetical protein [Escherichia coli]MCF6541068.1 hypothetical protein [Escherichia coli]